jgi:hypothetical protein
MRKILFLLASLVTFSSCQKEIEIDLNSTNPQYVVEGIITDQVEKYSVKITKTVNFSDPNTFPAIRGARVTIADNAGNTETLTETSAGIYQTQKLQGTSGRTYTLTINAEGKTFTAQSTMPAKVSLSGIKIAPSTFIPPGGDKDVYAATPQFTDPAGLGNNYRFIQSTQKETDKSIIIANDNVDDGRPNNRPVLSRDFKVKLGDTYNLEMQCIDKATYDYFNSLNLSSGNGPGGGTTPTNPVNNIQGGALGYFSAHTVQKMSIVVK